MSTEIVFVLDRSGSMSGLEDSVIEGFNSFAMEQRKLNEKTSLTTILFDDRYEILHDGLALKFVPPLTNKQYFTRGVTALYDAIGKAISTVSNRASKKHKVLFVINTDGMENASKEYTAGQIREMVKFREEHDDWKFIFLGANIDSFAVGGNLGIVHSFNVQNTMDGVAANYTAVSKTTRSFVASAGTQLDTKDLEKLNNTSQ
jgi:uncharacterized protein YegL